MGGECRAMNRRSFLKMMAAFVPWLVSKPHPPTPAEPSRLVYGGPSRLWEDFTPDEINSADFALFYRDKSGVDHPLGRSFGFCIPSEANIDGVTVKWNYSIAPIRTNVSSTSL